MNSKRLMSIDFLRGLAIIVLVFIHRIHYNWTGMRSDDTVKDYMSGPLLPILIFLILLLSMAGIFYYLTGIVNAYTIQKRIESGQNSWKQTMIFGFFGGIWLLILNYIQRLFFMNGFLVGKDGGTPEFPVGYLTGLIRNPDQVKFYWQQFTEPGTLSLIGILIITISIILSLLMSFRKKLNLSKIQLVIFGLAIAALFSSIFVKLYVTPLYENYFSNGQYFKAMLCGHLCLDFSLAPYLGYALIGAASGLGLAYGESRKIYKRKSVLTALGLILMGILIFLFFDKEKFGGRGTMGAMVSLVELGIFILFLLVLLKRFDYCGKEKREKRRIRTKWVRRFGMLSLTVFILEPILAEILKKAIDFVIGTTWNNHLILVTVFAGICLFTWHLLLILWQKVLFKGSFEWLTAWLLLKLAGKKSGKINFKEL